MTTDLSKYIFKILPAAQIHGTLQGFYYTLSQNDFGQQVNRSVVLNQTVMTGTTRYFILSKLQYFTRYSISIQAYNIAGIGPLSNNFSFITPESG